jgi:NADPH:quinone reductase
MAGTLNNDLQQRHCQDTKMKAVQIDRFGGPEIFASVEVPTPVPGLGQVLIRVKAVGVNFADTLMRANRYAMTPELPTILGSEAAGVVEATGPGVAEFSLGQRVAAPLFMGIGLGAYAEYVVIDTALAIALPDVISFDQAAAALSQGLTALFLTRQAPPMGKTVLVTAAAGGVGSILVQLAKRAGARKVIAAASSADKLDFAGSLGADAGVNYTNEDWTCQLHDATDGAGPDIIYESVGGDITAKNLANLAHGGEMVIYGALNIHSFNLGVPELLGMIFKNQSVTGFALVPLLTPAELRSGMAEIFDLMASGALVVSIGGRFPMRDAGRAHAALEGRGTSGKLILLPE